MRQNYDAYKNSNTKVCVFLCVCGCVEQGAARLLNPFDYRLLSPKLRHQPKLIYLQQTRNKHIHTHTVGPYAIVTCYSFSARVTMPPRRDRDTAFVTLHRQRKHRPGLAKHTVLKWLLQTDWVTDRELGFKIEPRYFLFWYSSYKWERQRMG